MKILWVRSGGRISLNLPHVWFVLGVRGSGKSSFLEALAELHLQRGNKVVDLFGSKDGESLAWLRSPWAEEKRILLLHGEAVDVDCSFDIKKAKDFSLGDIRRYDIIISSSPLYSNADDEFLNAAEIINRLYKRVAWRRLVYCIVREASNFYYSRLKVSENQTIAKSEMVYLIRESRHVGLSLGLDSIRYYSIDIDIRSLSDYLVLKAQGMHGLTKDLKWLYSIFDPHALRRMKPQHFIILSRHGGVGLGTFKAIPWHKREGENILKAVGVKVEYGEPVKMGEYRGKYRTLGDREHAELVRLYVEEGLSMRGVAERLGRSLYTVKSHIDRHNAAVQRAGYCPACRRAHSPLQSTMARRS